MLEGVMAVKRYELEHWRKPGRSAIWALAFGAALVAQLMTGCAHADKHKPEEAAALMGGIPTPPPPVFLGGAVAPLFTNVPGFRAHVVLERPASATRRDVTVGELMGRDGKLFFAPEPGAAPAGRNSRSEDFSYLWDVEQNRGFLLNGPLQGYAPLVSSLGYSNVVVGAPGNDPSEKVGGYACEKADITAVASNGTQTVFHAWRARELKGMPVRITGTVNGAPLTLNLSKIRLELPPADLFQPPADFTKYTSAEAMLGELAARQANAKRKRGWQPPPPDEIGNRDMNGVQMP